MLDGVNEREEIDRKFDIIVEAYNGNDDDNGDDDDDDDDDDDKKKKKKDKDDDDEKNEGKGKVDPDPDKKEDLKEDNSPFASHLNTYVQVLRENKI
jgi:hypothetical protein